MGLDQAFSAELVVLQALRDGHRDVLALLNGLEWGGGGEVSE